MAVPTSSQFVVQVVKVSRLGTTKYYLTAFMAFGRQGSTGTLTHLSPAMDGTPRFALTYIAGTGAQVWLPWTATVESEVPVGNSVEINGSPIVVQQPPDDLIPCP